jgi:hypothetical protein
MMKSMLASVTDASMNNIALYYVKLQSPHEPKLLPPATRLPARRRARPVRDATARMA